MLQELPFLCGTLAPSGESNCLSSTSTWLELLISRVRCFSPRTMLTGMRIGSIDFGRCCRGGMGGKGNCGRGGAKFEAATTCSAGDGWTLVPDMIGVCTRWLSADGISSMNGFNCGVAEHRRVVCGAIDKDWWPYSCPFSCPCSWFAFSAHSMIDFSSEVF